MSFFTVIGRVDRKEMIKRLSEFLKLREKHLEISEKFWKKYLVFGAFLFLTYFFSWSSSYQTILFLLFGLATSIIIFSGIFFYRPNPVPAWCLIGAGQCFNLMGDVAYKWEYHFHSREIIADLPKIFYFLGMASYFVGLFWIFSFLRKNLKKSHIIYGMISSIGLVAFLWITQISPHLGSITSPEDWIAILFFSSGILIICVLSSVFLLTPVGDAWSYRFLFIVLLLHAIALIFYDAQLDQTHVYVAGSINWVSIFNDSIYSLAYLLMGTAFIHPSIKTITEKMSGFDRQLSRQDLIALGTAFYLPPIGLLINHSNNIYQDFLIAIVSMLFIFILVEWRLIRVVRILELQNSSLFSQQAQLEFQALHDVLTGLPNRLYLSKYLIDLEKRRELSTFPVAVFMIDLNKFKQVNDIFGHNNGDVVLKKISDQLASFSRKGDFLGRWGGDEFLFILENINTADALAFAHRLSKEVTVSMKVSEVQIDVDISIGICMLLEKHLDWSTIINQSDIALYKAKTSLHKKIEIFSTIS
jgi:diguanylate cyclase